jgi:1,2-diacylglycerol 3-alpha-glucosyltransferase
MKILISSDVYEYQTTGATNSIVTLRDELRKRGHDVRMLVLSPNNKSYFHDNAYYIASKPIQIYPGARISLKKHDKLIDEIIKWQPDIVHAQSEFSSKILVNRVIKQLHIPFVMTCHAQYEEYTKYFCPSRKLGRAVVKMMSRKIYNPAKTLIAPSNKMRVIEEGYGVKCPIEVIPTGIDLQKYQKKLSAKEKAKLLAGLHLRSTDKILVTVCRLAVEKNIDEILAYLPNLLKKEKLKFVIVGDGPYRKKLEKKVAKMGLEKYVIFTGMIPADEVYKYYQLGDVFVCASTSETQGLTYVEALAAGLPLVCKKDDCLEGIIDNGINGYTFEDEQEFTNSVRTILNNESLKKKMGKKSFEKSMAFSKEEFGTKIEQLYLELY